MPASVRQRLLNLAAKVGDDPNVLWTRYAIERLLYRLSVSAFNDRFVLKGAVLFSVWSDAPHRPTMDLDLEGFGENSDAWAISVFKQVCQIPNDVDGLSFDADSVHAEPIREGMEYQGRRIKLIAYLVALTDEFTKDTQKCTQWGAFMRKISGKKGQHPEFGDVIIALRQFSLPILGISQGKQILKSWPPNGPWQGDL